MPTPPSLARLTAPRLLSAVATSLLAAILYRLPPTRYAFYPQCPVWTFFHLRCPGCGTTRALAALLHGHLAEALHANALTTCTLPILLLWLALRLTRPATLPHPPRAAIAATGLAIAAAFTLARNL